MAGSPSTVQGHACCIIFYRILSYTLSTLLVLPVLQCWTHLSHLNRQETQNMLGFQVPVRCLCPAMSSIKSNMAKQCKTWDRPALLSDRMDPALLYWILWRHIISRCFKCASKTCWKHCTGQNPCKSCDRNDSKQCKDAMMENLDVSCAEFASCFVWSSINWWILRSFAAGSAGSTKVDRRPGHPCVTSPGLWSFWWFGATWWLRCQSINNETK